MIPLLHDVYHAEAQARHAKAQARVWR